jgi:hypothetical protein
MFGSFGFARTFKSSAVDTFDFHIDNYIVDTPNSDCREIRIKIILFGPLGFTRMELCCRHL